MHLHETLRGGAFTLLIGRWSRLLPTPCRADTMIRLYGLGMGRPVGIQDYIITAKPLEPFEHDLTSLPSELGPLQNMHYLDSDISISARHTCEMFQIASEVLERL
jgi:hypothetical protein